jgi:hypothetical protein
MKANGIRTFIIRGVLLIILSLYFCVVFAQKTPNLVSFDANRTAQNISLQWQLAPSNNLSAVIIEKKLPDNSFRAIAQFWVNFDGNTECKFHFVDKKVKAKKAQYRLKLENDNGEVQYSDVISAKAIATQKAAEKFSKQNSFITLNKPQSSYINTDHLKSLLLLTLQEREVNSL